MELTYSWHGDYLLPDIVIPEKAAKLPSLTKWGLLRKSYLKDSRQIIYANMLLTGELFPHCYEIEQQAETRFEVMMKQATANSPISENLKNTDPGCQPEQRAQRATRALAWVGHMNALRAQVEKAILAELIYV